MNPIRCVVPLLFLLLGACTDDAPRWPPLADDAVILAFGDSLTHGTGAARDASYPSVLERLSGRRVVNAGVPGEVTAAGLARFGAVLDQVAPAIVVLCHGGNDLLRKLNRDHARANLEAMIAQARSHGAQVLLLGVPAPGVFLSTADLYHDVAAATATPLEDEALADILGDAGMKSDPVHPNAAGYRALAERVFARLEALGAL